MSDPTNDTPINNDKPDYEHDVYEREKADSEYENQRFCDYYGNNRRG
jgi:hypothetical protein